MGKSLSGIMLPECYPVHRWGGKAAPAKEASASASEKPQQGHREADPPSCSDLHIPVLTRGDEPSTIATYCDDSPRLVSMAGSTSDGKAISISIPEAPPATPALNYCVDDDREYRFDAKHPSSPSVSSPSGEPCVVFEDDSAHVVVDQEGTSVLWGWKLFDAGLQKALHKSRVQYAVDEVARRETERARSESIRKYIEDDQKRQIRHEAEEEEKAKLEEAVAASLAQHRQENEEALQTHTEQARAESIRLYEEEECKRKQRMEEEKTKWEAAVAASLAQHELDEKRRRRWEVIDIGSTAELLEEFEVKRIPGDGLCLYNSLFQGLRQLGLIPEGNSFPSFLEHLSRNIRNVREYKEVYKPIFAYTDLETVNQMSPRNIRDREVNGRIDPLVKVRGALCLSLGDAELNGRRINSEIVWGDHLELFFILMIFAVNAVIFETDTREKYVRTQTNVLHKGRPIIYLQKKPNHYNLLIPRNDDGGRKAAESPVTKCFPAS